MNELIKSAGKALSKNSPTILAIGGIGVTAVLACVATRNLVNILKIVKKGN